MKNKFLLLLSMLVATPMVASCNNVADVTLVNFENQSIVCDYQDLYNVPVIASVFDENGNSYDVVTKVTDSKGNSVDFLGNQFFVTDIDGYTVTYTAKIGGKDYVKTIEISVENHLRPQISFQSELNSTYKMTDVITLPLANSYRATGEPLDVNYKLLHVANSVETEITIPQNRQFTPTNPGSYVYSAESTDPNGRTASKELPFYIIEPVKVNEIQCFSGPDSIYNCGSNISSRADNPAKWLETYDGHNGVAKITFQNVFDMVNAYFKPEQEKSAYNGYNNIVFKMKIVDPDNAITRLNFTAYNNFPTPLVVRNEWENYILPISFFMDNYDDFTTRNVNAYFGFKRTKDVGGDIDIYIDEIIVANVPTISFANGSSIPDIIVGGKISSLPTATAKDNDQTSLNVTYKMLHEDNNGNASEISYTAGQTLTETGNYIYRAYATGVDNVEVHADLRFSVDLQPLPGEINNYNFSSSTTANGTNISSRGDNPSSWLSEFNGHSGVVSTVFQNKFDSIVLGIRARQDKTAYENYENIAITMYIDDQANSINRVNFTAFSGFFYTSNVVRNQWWTLIVPIDTFLNNFNSFIGDTIDWNASLGFRQVKNTGAANVTIYLDSITCINPPKITWSANSISNVTSGDPIPTLPTATAKDKNNNPLTPTYSLLFIDNGEEVELDYQEGFVPQEIGTYIYRATATDSDGVTGTSDLRFSVSEQLGAGVIQSYSNESAVTGTGYNLALRSAYSQAQWLSSYEGRNGIMKITFTNKFADWGFFMIPGQAKSAYEGYEKINCKIYFDDPGNQLVQMNLSGYSGFNIVNSFERGKWTEVQFDIGVLLNNFEGFATAHNDSQFHFRRLTSGGDMTVYVDEFYCS